MSDSAVVQLFHHMEKGELVDAYPQLLTLAKLSIVPRLTGCILQMADSDWDFWSRGILLPKESFFEHTHLDC